MFYNYKGQFSSVLMAVCDAELRFTYVSIGSARIESDGGIFQATEIGKQLLSGTLPIPQPKTLPQTSTRVAAVLVGDAAFPLLLNLMKPYPVSSLTPEKTIFNYLQSRARRIIENTFGVLSARWRILRKRITVSMSTVDSIVQACVVLHNWLRDAEHKNVTWPKKKYACRTY